MVDRNQPNQSPDAPRRLADSERRQRDPEKWIHRPMEKYRKGKNALGHRPNNEFFAVADQVVQSEFHAWDMRTEQLMLLKR